MAQSQTQNSRTLSVLLTGGAGFVGANLAIGLAERHPEWSILALDNLKRRGSELNLSRLREAGVRFIHGDVRELDDLTLGESIDAVIECSAEPSVLASAVGDGGHYAMQTNLFGAYHCLELARREQAQFVFLSTSRVYPIAAIESARYEETDTRLVLTDDQPREGVSAAGISEQCSLEGARTMYGATKLAGELLIAEYADTTGMRAVINRCGVIAGPWQMGKVDQGVFTYWMLAHYFKRELNYIGHGGTGKQVRDLIHVADILDLVERQLLAPDEWAGATVNVGGGNECSLSLAESTTICEELTGNKLSIGSELKNRPGDVPIYISDCGRLFSRSDWRPRRSPQQIMGDIFTWVNENERDVLTALSL